MDAAYYGLVALACLVALADWRAAVFLCLVLDMVRDPVRKLLPDQPVLVTVAVGLVWGAVFLGACASQKRRMAALGSACPRLRPAFWLLVAGLAPAAAVSMISYEGGWKLAAIGGASYLFPVAAVLTGWTYARTDEDVARLFRFYCLVTAVALTGTLLEYLGSALPGLGGMRVHWIRFGGDYHVNLISGFYRSPDIMGLHAATAMMFAFLLAYRTRGAGRWFWLSVVAYAGLCVLLSGRRKMIAMPFVFAAVFLALHVRSSRRSRAGYAAAMVGLAAVGAGLLVYQADVSEEYITFAQTTVLEALDRLQAQAVGGSLYTPVQSGIFGWGLGTTTQGNYHLGVSGYRTWQEDGVSRLVAELGVPGAICALWAGWAVAWTCCRAARAAQPGGPAYAMTAGLLAVCVANLASFVISHQVYSGDPSSIMIAAMCLGMFFAAAVRARGPLAAGVGRVTAAPFTRKRRAPRPQPAAVKTHRP